MPFKFTGFADEAGQAVSEQIAATKRAGWRSIEIRKLNGKHYAAMSDAEFWPAIEELQQAGIEIAGFGGAIANWSRPISGDFQLDIDELKASIPRMHRCGVKLLRIMCYPNDQQNPWADKAWRDEAFRRIKELATIAADGGVILAHENCSGYASIGPAETLDMIATVDNPALQLIMDTGNTTIHDGDREASWRYYDACREHFVHVHIKAAKQNDDGKWITAYPDEDPVQARILRDLRQHDYAGWISIEPHLAAQIHTGSDVDDSAAASAIYVEYAQRLARLIAGL